ncbi:hypothetical protein ACN28I_23345 [Archangium gephyra]|uniref:hypothetical protein n=1 Tax=Archangium gephyra TaxID=48 RepID=UPI003B7DA63D
MSRVAWSDALQNTTRNIASALHVEIALNTALDEPLRAYGTTSAHGQESRAQGTFLQGCGHG